MKYEIKPYKNRSIDYERKVDIYRCLTRKGYVYSIRQRGVVVGHTSSIILKDVTFKVNKAGKLKAIESGIRNVHAFINGFIDCTLQDTDVIGKLSYYPFNEDNFMCEGKEITECECLTINYDELTVDTYVRF